MSKMSKMSDLADAFGRLVTETVQAMTLPEERLMIDEQLLDRLKYHVFHHNFNSGLKETKVLAHEILHRVGEDRTNHPSLIPYAQAISRIPSCNRDNAYVLKNTFRDVMGGTLPAINRSQRQRTLENQ